MAVSYLSGESAAPKYFVAVDTGTTDWHLAKLSRAGHWVVYVAVENENIRRWVKNALTNCAEIFISKRPEVKRLVEEHTEGKCRVFYSVTYFERWLESGCKDD